MIEREKIRHRRPNDLMFDGDGPQAADLAQRPADTESEIVIGDDYDDRGGYEETSEIDWSDQGDAVAETADWDEEAEGDWVLDSDGEPATAEGGDEIYVEDGTGDADDGAYLDDDDDGGVVWEDDGSADEETFEQPDDVTFGGEDRAFGFAPEVELAGRRDVSPKPPRPAPSPRPKMPRPAAKAKSAQSQESPRQRDAWSPDDDELDGGGPPSMEDAFAPQPAGPMPDRGPDDDGRLFRARAVSGAVGMGGAVARRLGGVGDADEQVLQRPRPEVSARRRQTQAPPASLKQTGRRRGGRRSRGGGKRWALAALIILAIGAGGWLAYRSMGADGFQPMIDRVASLLPFTGSTRTASDTSFGEPGREGTVSAEQALSALEDRARQENAAAAAVDPATIIRGDGPPIPQFKPLPGQQAPLPADRPAATIDEARLAANGGESGEGEAGEPSLFEQLWRYLSPG